MSDPSVARDSSREDERLDTRRKLLEAAGQVFAERGLQGATGKEISERAGANAAAVNYHFGGIEGLYEAVLAEARDSLVSAEEFAAAVSSQAPADEKLRALARLIARSLLDTGRPSWALRVLGREIIAPSPLGARLLAATAKPRIQMLRSLAAEIMGLPEGHPAVSHGCIALAAPFQILLLANRGMIARVYPDLTLDAAGAEALTDNLIRYARAGLRAIAARYST